MRDGALACESTAGGFTAIPLLILQYWRAIVRSLKNGTVQQGWRSRLGVWWSETCGVRHGSKNHYGLFWCGALEIEVKDRNNKPFWPIITIALVAATRLSKNNRKRSSAGGVLTSSILRKITMAASACGRAPGRVEGPLLLQEAQDHSLGLDAAEELRGGRVPLGDGAPCKHPHLQRPKPRRHR